LSQLLTGTFNKQFSTYSSATMSNYQTKYTVACKTGSTDYDNLIVAYNPNILITGWVGYDDNRKIEQSEEKVITKDVTISFLNKHIKKESWYYPTSKLNAISINPLSGEFDENGIVYWFRKGTP
jgi:membrane peptidoglycan carboxypeptidase